MQMKAKGTEAARLRNQKFDWLRRFPIPAEALPGSLSLTQRRCGKPNCCCVAGNKHPLWQLTFMVHGKKRVERIPEAWVTEVRRFGDDTPGYCTERHDAAKPRAALAAQRFPVRVERERDEYRKPYLLACEENARLKRGLIGQKAHRPPHNGGQLSI